MGINNSFLATVKEHSDLSVIFQMAYGLLSKARAQHEELGSMPNEPEETFRWIEKEEPILRAMSKAEGMAVAAALIDKSPFTETTSAVKFLYWLVENPEEARSLYFY